MIRLLTTTVLAAALMPALAAGLAAQPAFPEPIADTDFLDDGTPPPARVALGQMLFFDPILSGNRNISCGTCHDPGLGTGDGVALGIGEGGSGLGPDRRTAEGVIGRVPRNAQPLYNVGARQYRAMFHDGRLEPDPEDRFASGFRNPADEELPAGLDSVLAAQAMFPVTSHIEMAGQNGENPVATAVAEDRIDDAWALLAARLAETPGYGRLFAAAFDDVRGPEDITFVHAARALAAFQTVAFRSDRSPFDRVLGTGETGHLPPDARAGMALFYGDAGCAGCHEGALLTDHDFHAIAVPQIGPGKGHGGDNGYKRATGLLGRLEDEGRYRVTLDTDDLFAFRTPSLRNVALTGPWGHDGAFTTLEAMVRHHLDPVTSLEAYEPANVGLPRLDEVMVMTGRPSQLMFRPLEQDRLAAFEMRDGWVQGSAVLRRRIAESNSLAAVELSDAEVRQILAFLDTLTDPSARDRSDLIPHAVPSGLPPQPAPRAAVRGQ